MIIHILGPGGSGKTTLGKKISKLNNVETAFNRYIHSGIMKFNNNQEMAMIASVPQGKDKKIFYTMLNLNANPGRLLKDTDTNKVVLGSNFLKDGNRFGKAMKVGDKLSLEGKNIEVVGFLEKKGSFIFDSVVLFNEDYMILDKPNPDLKIIHFANPNTEIHNSKYKWIKDYWK